MWNQQFTCLKCLIKWLLFNLIVCFYTSVSNILIRALFEVIMGNLVYFWHRFLIWKLIECVLLVLVLFDVAISWLKLLIVTLGKVRIT